jgi:hypothetical protein
MGPYIVRHAQEGDDERCWKLRAAGARHRERTTVEPAGPQGTRAYVTRKPLPDLRQQGFA